MADLKKHALNDEIASHISGGKLPANWKNLIDVMYPTYASQYEDITYEEAVDLIGSYLNDEKEVQLVSEYIKEKYF